MLRWVLDRFRRKKIIIIAPRRNNIWAGLKDDAGMLGEGKSLCAALGDLVFRHQDAFGVEVRTTFYGKPMQPLDGEYVTIPEDQYNALMSKAGWSRK